VQYLYFQSLSSRVLEPNRVLLGRSNRKYAAMMTTLFALSIFCSCLNSAEGGAFYGMEWTAHWLTVSAVSAAHCLTPGLSLNAQCAVICYTVFMCGFSVAFLTAGTSPRFASFGSISSLSQGCGCASSCRCSMRASLLLLLLPLPLALLAVRVRRRSL
jgi:hypothetical protein